jgi:hypothetical protein
VGPKIVEMECRTPFDGFIFGIVEFKGDPGVIVQIFRLSGFHPVERVSGKM